MDELHALVAYEPCAGFHVDEDAALCADCGWHEDEHDPVLVERHERGATPLRRAS